MGDKLKVITEDLTNHPHCPHGPTLLFARIQKDTEAKELFYACSACRSSKYCPTVHISVDKHNPKSNNNDKNYSQQHYEKAQQKKEARDKIISMKAKSRGYCQTCGVLLSKKDVESHADHDILIGISDDLLSNPTKLLCPASNEKTNAQYFFTGKTVRDLMQVFEHLNISKVICMGAPRLHEHIKNNSNSMKSFLLDIDDRLLNFYWDKEFAWYNMFNNYFFLGNRDEENFQKFLIEEHNEKVLLILDPPFGARTEPLTQTIKEISSLYRHVNSRESPILSIFWIFPYYMETYVKNSIPEMEMCDYKIAYSNHSSYSDESKSGRKYGSPVRIFTNIDLKFIQLPANEGYRFCVPCQRWVANENLHCKCCGECASKNGQTYQHCELCATCVKPNYVHCRGCGRCTQASNHSCKEYQATLNCWICRRSGHCEKKCASWMKVTKRWSMPPISNVKNGRRRCMICRKVGQHNEKRCPLRKTLLREDSFLGEVSNIFDQIQ